MQESVCLQQLKSCDLFRELSEHELSVLYASMEEMSDVCIKPVLSGFGFLDASNKDELIELGYVAAQESLQGWQRLLDYSGD